MDPISQAVLGASLSQTFAKNKASQLSAMTIGALAAMAPDLDIFIRSSVDPLLTLEFHRQFTHALIFIPLGALVCAIVFYFFINLVGFWRANLNRGLTFLQVYWFSFLGYATHGFLDANTSYGTQLLWPFSNERIAWNTISVVDPLFTLPILILIILSVSRRTKRYATIAFIYAMVYLSLGVFQHQRAEASLIELAQKRGHIIERMQVKPSFANRHVWKMLYEHNGYYYVDAVKFLLDKQIFPGESIAKLNVDKDLAWLNKESQSAKDIERFRWFSDDYLALYPSMSNYIIDVRYSLLPNSIRPLWGIQIKSSTINNNELETHVDFITNRNRDLKTREMFIDMLF